MEVTRAAAGQADKKWVEQHSESRWEEKSCFVGKIPEHWNILPYS
jgi:hypothetical protein